MYATRVPFSDLEGKTIHSIKQSKEEIVFECVGGYTYKMYHNQDCCESVYIEDIDGNLQELVGEKVITAYESTNQDLPAIDPRYDDSYTWTFYTIRTNKDSLTIRWYGTSNGYYSESVDFEQIADPTKDFLPEKIDLIFATISWLISSTKTKVSSGEMTMAEAMLSIQKEVNRQLDRVATMAL